MRPTTILTLLAGVCCIVFLQSNLQAQKNTHHGVYLFPTNKKLQWAVNQLGKTLDSKMERSIERISNEGSNRYSKGKLYKSTKNGLSIWDIDMPDGMEMQFFFDHNKACVKVAAQVSEVHVLYLYYKEGRDYFSFLKKGIYTPETLDQQLAAEPALKHTHIEVACPPYYKRKVYFIGYEPMQWLINIHTANYENTDGSYSEKTHYLSVSTLDMDDSRRDYAYGLNTEPKHIPYPADYKALQPFIAKNNKALAKAQQIANLPRLQPTPSNMLDLSNGICLEGCESSSKKGMIHFGNYLYIGGLYNGLPDDVQGTAQFYHLHKMNQNNAFPLDAYCGKHKINTVIRRGVAYLDYLSYDDKTGIAVAKPYDHPLLKKKVYPQVFIKKGNLVDTTLANLYTSADCADDHRVYTGAINRKFEAHGFGSLLYAKGEKQDEEVIINTYWKNNQPDGSAIKQATRSKQGQQTTVVTRGGFTVHSNILNLMIDTDKNRLIIAATLVSITYEESILANPEAKPVSRIVGNYAYVPSSKKAFIYDDHHKQTYLGGDPDNPKSWKTTATCQLGSVKKETSCFVSGDNFYKLPPCQTNSSVPSKDWVPFTGF